ncbi:MAG: DUF6448 family protein [Thermincola sp.]|nr:DUF6448 family protein [Thermincola sp.]MDT3702280.1 DUF6448 family protein [Thermincola sp.]
MKKARKPSKFLVMLIMAMAVIMVLPGMASAHCDTMDGPTVADAKKAIEENNVNYVLKWVTPGNAGEITEIFKLTMKVRGLSADAKELADRYFFENLVRIHRAGEGAPYTGVKPVGTPIDEKIMAADKSIETGSLAPLEKFVPADKMPELEKRFAKVMSLKNFDVNDVEAGREYIEAYVQFFHFAEGEEEGHAGHDSKANEGAHVDAKDNHATENHSEENHGEKNHGQENHRDEDHAANPKTGDAGIITLAAGSVIAGIGAIAIRSKRKSN